MKICKDNGYNAWRYFKIKIQKKFEEKHYKILLFLNTRKFM